MEESVVVISLAAVGLELLAFIGGGVWIVATMRSESRENRRTSKALQGAIKELKTTIEKLDEKLDKHEIRLTRLETSRQGA